MGLAILGPMRRAPPVKVSSGGKNCYGETAEPCRLGDFLQQCSPARRFKMNHPWKCDWEIRNLGLVLTVLRSGVSGEQLLHREGRRFSFIENRVNRIDDRRADFTAACGLVDG
jgi:hypothetical protein